MDVQLTSPGTYVVAVSGGVDSMALLHMLSRNPDYTLVVAHMDHGIRADSSEDRKLVQATAKRLELPFIYKEARLGAGASEAAARQARYVFLQDILKQHDARAIVTAHHQDDVLETAVINLMRGTNRRGLTALASRDGVERPLLTIDKSELISYAKQYAVPWREDSTNQDTDYLRNYVRHHLLPRFDANSRRQLLEIVTGLRDTNAQIDDVLTKELAQQLSAGRIDRAWFAELPHNVARETMAAWLRDQGLRDFDSKTLERLVVAAKTAQPGKSFDVLRGATLEVGRQHLALTGAER